MRLIEIDSLSNQSLVNPLLVGSYTADAERGIFSRVFLNQIAGNGDYLFWLEIQRLGAGAFHRSAITTVPVASGTTACFGSTVIVPVNDTDVIRAYVQGLAADTTTPDSFAEWWEDNSVISIGPSYNAEMNLDASGNVTVEEFTVPALQQFFTTDTLLQYADAIDRSVLKEILDGVPPSSIGASAVWSYASRTLTQTFAQIINAVTGANQISLYRGDTNEINLVIGDISDYLNLDFVIKNDYEDNDDQSVLWVRKNITGSADGLLALYDYEQNGGIIDPTWANVVINDASTGDILITVEAEAAQHLKRDVELFWDVHKITATQRKTKKNGFANIDPDVGNAII